MNQVNSLPFSSKAHINSELALIILLALLQFTFLLDYIMLMPLGPLIISSLSVMPSGFSYLISGYTFSAAISGFLASFIIDKFERKSVLLFCFSGFSIGSLFCALSFNFETLLMARVCTGAFGGMLSVMIMTILGDAIAPEKMGRATSFVLTANAIASIIAVPAALYVAAQWDWKMPFYISFFINIIICLLIVAIVPRMRNHLKNTQPSVNLWTAIKRPDFKWPLIFMSLLTLAGGFTILPFLSTFMATNYGFKGEDISLLFFMGGLGSFFASPIVGTLSDRLGKQNIFLLLNFLSIIPILLLTIYPLETKIIAISVSTLFFMFSTARHISGMALVNSRIDGKMRGKFISLNTSIQLMAGSLGTVLAGYILSTEDGKLINFDIIGVIAMCATIICIFAAFMIEE
jgi:predicted MFS family arabinose efflux permease